MSNNVVNTMQSVTIKTQEITHYACSACNMRSDMHPVAIVPHMDQAVFSRDASTKFPDRKGEAMISVTGRTRDGFGVYFICEIPVPAKLEMNSQVLLPE